MPSRLPRIGVDGHQFPLSLERYAVFTLGSAATRIRVASERALSDNGLNLADIAALSVIADVGPLSQATLAERIGVDRATMTELARNHEDDGLLQREEHPRDRRRTLLTATTSGRTWLAEAKAVLAATQDQFLHPLPLIERARLISLLAKLAPGPPRSLDDLAR